jgi:hypothetical protein
MDKFQRSCHDATPLLKAIICSNMSCLLVHHVNEVSCPCSALHAGLTLARKNALMRETTNIEEARKLAPCGRAEAES